MRKTLLLALAATSLLGACVASVGPARRSGPPGPPPSEPPPPPPPERRHHEHDRPAEPRIIEGTVLDAETHRPVGRASIDITKPGVQGELMTVQTGADGRYRTGEIPRGQFGIRCRREGYEVFQRQAEMNDGVAHIDFELVPKRR